ncbi:arginyltransferase [Marinimicrobium alkaliphilum]|uniref:arginyltransferase n=1 Tax=Marinimicrobium alkaliphilum TaxID=2202654 RepID=UPI000DBA097F|nr:arginyltransferase [Marinimicrobium alkaliphilum]
MSDLSNLKLYATQPHPCSYLEDEEATTIFVDPQAPMDKMLYSQLSQIGFRRSGGHLYRPHCAQCRACISCRVPVSAFVPSRSQRRCWRRNTDIEIRPVSDIQTDEHYSLYAEYIAERHRDGDMYPPSQSQYEAFLSSEWGTTGYLEFRLDGRLLGVAVFDQLNDGISAVYTFFDNHHPGRGLGVYGILAQIELARNMGLDYVYLGYWIKACDKMNYKTRYRPLELLINRRWTRLL